MRIITNGDTRVVAVTSRYAFKFARFRPFYSLLRLLRHHAGDRIQPRLLTYDRNMFWLGLRKTFPGIAANYTEWKNWREFRDAEHMAPTLFTLCWLVNIQQAGEQVGETEAARHPIVQTWRSVEKFQDCTRPAQYCLLNGRVCISDYGNEEFALVFRGILRSTRATNT